VFHVEQRESSTFAALLMGGLVLSVLVSRGTVVFEVRVRVSRETVLFICQSNRYPAKSLFHVEQTIGQSVSSVNRLIADPSRIIVSRGTGFRR
jgi:hypothetical protein